MLDSYWFLGGGGKKNEMSFFEGLIMIWAPT